jgi:RNA polymerase sigma-70 factor (ECF subfamily)
MPTGFVSTIDDNEAAFASIGGLAGAEDMVLVADAKSGSSHAFEVLVERHAQKILSVAQRVTHSREDAEDIVQQTFQQAFVHLQKFEGRSSFSTWLTRIAKNEALMCLRTSRRKNTISLDESASGEEAAYALQIPDLGPSPERSCSEQEREGILSIAMSDLTPGIRTAIQLFELDERSIKESAQIMGVSVSAVKSRVLRGRRKLRETFAHLSRSPMSDSEMLQINADTNGNSR